MVATTRAEGAGTDDNANDSKDESDREDSVEKSELSGPYWNQHLIGSVASE